MSEMRDILADTVTKLFGDLVTRDVLQDADPDHMVAQLGDIEDEGEELYSGWVKFVGMEGEVIEINIDGDPVVFICAAGGFSMLLAGSR